MEHIAKIGDYITVPNCATVGTVKNIKEGGAAIGPDPCGKICFSLAFRRSKGSARRSNPFSHKRSKAKYRTSWRPRCIMDAKTVRPCSSATTNSPSKMAVLAFTSCTNASPSVRNPESVWCLRDTKRHVPCSITAKARKPSCLIS